jgi:hypothetical protein
MEISLITPANKGTRSGNRTTAVRWARMLCSFGHRVDIATRFDGTPVNLMIARMHGGAATAIAPIAGVVRNSR